MHACTGLRTAIRADLHTGNSTLHALSRSHACDQAAHRSSSSVGSASCVLTCCVHCCSRAQRRCAGGGRRYSTGRPSCRRPGCLQPLSPPASSAPTGRLNQPTYHFCISGLATGLLGLRCLCQSWVNLFAQGICIDLICFSLLFHSVYCLTFPKCYLRYLLLSCFRRTCMPYFQDIWDSAPSAGIVLRWFGGRPHGKRDPARQQLEVAGLRVNQKRQRKRRSGRRARKHRRDPAPGVWHRPRLPHAWGARREVNSN